MSRLGWPRPRLRQVQIGGPGSVQVQAGRDVFSARPVKWWCDCDVSSVPHVHCKLGRQGAHTHTVIIPDDHRERRR